MEKRTRKQRFSVQEIKVLLNGVSMHKDVIAKKGLDYSTQKKKSVWAAISEEVNNCDAFAPQRTVGDVKKKWNDMKCAVHRYQLELRRSLIRAASKKASGDDDKPPGPPKMPAFFDIIIDILQDDPYTLMNRNGITVAMADAEIGLDMTVEHHDESSRGVRTLLDENPLDMSVDRGDVDSQDCDKVSAITEKILNSHIKRDKQCSVNLSNDSSSEDESLSVTMATTTTKPFSHPVEASTSHTPPISIKPKPPETLSTAATPPQLLEQRLPILLHPVSGSVLPTMPIPLVYSSNGTLGNISAVPHIYDRPAATSSSHPVSVPECHPNSMKADRVLLKSFKRKLDSGLYGGGSSSSGGDDGGNDSSLWEAYLQSEMELNAEKIRLKKVKQNYYMKKMELLDKGNFQL